MLSLLATLVLSAPAARAVGVLSDGTIVLETAGHYDLVPPGQLTAQPAPEGWALPAVLPMSAGPVSPTPGHAVLVTRKSAEDGGVRVEHLDALGRHAVAQLDPSCPPDAAPDLVTAVTRLSVHWADGALTGAPTRAVVLGALPDCGDTARPVLLVVDAGPPMTNAQQQGAARELISLMATGVLDPMLAEAAVALAPDLPDPLVALAHARAAADDGGGAVAALWALSASSAPDAPEHLRAAMATDWATPLRTRAAYRALEWSLAPTPLAPAADPATGPTVDPGIGPTGAPTPEPTGASAPEPAGAPVPGPVVAPAQGVAP